jgi:hypothetical protein
LDAVGERGFAHHAFLGTALADGAEFGDGVSVRDQVECLTEGSALIVAGESGHDHALLLLLDEFEYHVCQIGEEAGLVDANHVIRVKVNLSKGFGFDR